MSSKKKTLRLYDANPAVARVRRATIRRNTLGKKDLPQPNRKDKGTREEAQEEEAARKWSDEVGASDMIKLEKLTTESLVDNLRLRYSKDLIYTYVGSILVAANPFQRLPGYYGPAVMKQYRGQRLAEQPPHIFGVAEAAHRDLREGGSSVSIVISGESGAGKTETCKLILNYISGLSKDPTEVEARIIESASLLEAFGNAKTARNNNSSRFGKLIKILFTRDLRIAGATIETYLLEKSRVTVQEEGERNYHIFYQLCGGASAAERKRYHLRDASEFRLTSTCVDLGVDEAEELQATRDGLTLFGFSEAEVDFVFRVVSGLLHLGEVQFDYDDARGRALVPKESQASLKLASELLGLKLKELEKVLCQRKISVRGTNITKGLTQEEAGGTRDAMCRNIYSAMFDWVVERINESLKPDDSSGALRSEFISVLDIFGFENFEQNSFEQLCINYANEKLHAQFLEHVFELEQREYAEEGIKWEKLSAQDNSACIHLIESKMGILSLLDEESKLQSGSDDSFLKKLLNNHGSHSHLEKPRLARDAFTVHHYAEGVTYTAPGFRDKNQNVVAEDVNMVLSNSELDLLCNLFPEPTEGAKRGRPKSVSSVFKTQLITLKKTLDATKPHFVRCCKPNSQQAPNLFEDVMVTSQLNYSGMVETTRIRAQGFPTRLPFDAFAFRYRALGVKDDIGAFVSSCAHASDMRTGTTKVFLRSAAYDALEAERARALVGVVTKLQAHFLMVPQRARFRKKRAAASLIGRNVRAHIANERTKRCVVAALACVHEATRLREEEKRKAQARAKAKEEARRRKEKAEAKARQKKEAEAEARLKEEAEALLWEEQERERKEEAKRLREEKKKARRNRRKPEPEPEPEEEEAPEPPPPYQSSSEEDDEVMSAPPPSYSQSVARRKPPPPSSAAPRVVDRELEARIADIRAQIPPSDGYLMIEWAKARQLEVKNERPPVADVLYERATEVYKRAMAVFVSDSDLCINAGTCSINHANLRFVMDCYPSKSKACLPLLSDAEQMLEAALQKGKLDLEGRQAVQLRLSKVEELKRRALDVDIESAGPEHRAKLIKDIESKLKKQPAVEKMGKCKKKGGGKAAGATFGRSNWTTRIFKLDETSIKYYAKSVAEKPKGEIQLAEVTGVKPIIIPKHPHAFVIALGDRLYNICAPDETEMKAWIRDISTNVERIKLLHKLEDLK